MPLRLLVCLYRHPAPGRLVRGLDGQTPRAGGLGWGDGPVSLGLTLLIVGLVAYLSITRVDLDDKVNVSATLG